MRDTILLASCVTLLISTSAYAAPVETTDNAVVMTDTPSGEGNPNIIVCRAPQELPGSALFGPKLCGYNYEWWQLTTHGKDLARDGKTVIDRKMVADPRGTGNPDAVTCREPQPLPRRGGLRIDHFGPEVCQTNRFWASLIKDRKAVAANGYIVSVSPSLPITGGSTFVNPLDGYRVGGP